MTDLYQNSAIQLLSLSHTYQQIGILSSPGQATLEITFLKSNREVRGCLWPTNEKSELSMYYNHKALELP